MKDNKQTPAVRCCLHGSFRKNYDRIVEVGALFKKAGIEIVAPNLSRIVGETDGFVHLEEDISKDPRLTELIYLHKVAKMGPNGFSYYVNPGGKIGVSASYELAIDQLTNTRTIFMEELSDHPAFVPRNSVWKPKELADFVLANGSYPPPVQLREEQQILELAQDLILPGSVICVGGIIVDYSDKRYTSGQEREVLLVKTHKWGGRFSVVGGKVRRNERLGTALAREVMEETGLESNIGESICTFDHLKGSGYYQGEQLRVYTDNVVEVRDRNVRLNDEAEDYLWVPPTEALRTLDIEPNAKKTLQEYKDKFLKHAA